jgi:hypothetical protein
LQPSWIQSEIGFVYLSAEIAPFLYTHRYPTWIVPRHREIANSAQPQREEKEPKGLVRDWTQFILTFFIVPQYNKNGSKQS